MAAGYALAADYPGSTVEKLARRADKSMYVHKAEYYRASDKDRRKR